MTSADSAFVHITQGKLLVLRLGSEFVARWLKENRMDVGRMILPGLLCVLASLSTTEADAGSLLEEQRCMALALYWEARGEGRRGMVAVGWTILNRAGSELFPESPCAVVYQGSEQSPCQFSWWCDGKSDQPGNRNSWTRALIIASELLLNPPRDPTNGALFYHSRNIALPWKRTRVRTVRIGNHIFYR